MARNILPFVILAFVFFSCRGLPQKSGLLEREATSASTADPVHRELDGHGGGNSDGATPSPESCTRVTLHRAKPGGLPQRGQRGQGSL